MGAWRRWNCTYVKDVNHTSRSPVGTLCEVNETNRDSSGGSWTVRGGVASAPPRSPPRPPPRSPPATQRSSRYRGTEHDATPGPDTRQQLSGGPCTNTVRPSRRERHHRDRHQTWVPCSSPKPWCWALPCTACRTAAGTARAAPSRPGAGVASRHTAPTSSVPWPIGSTTGRPPRWSGNCLCSTRELASRSAGRVISACPEG